MPSARCSRSKVRNYWLPKPLPTWPHYCHCLPRTRCQLANTALAFGSRNSEGCLWPDWVMSSNSAEGLRAGSSSGSSHWHLIFKWHAHENMVESFSAAECDVNVCLLWSVYAGQKPRIAFRPVDFFLKRAAIEALAIWECQRIQESKKLTHELQRPSLKFRWKHHQVGRRSSNEKNIEASRSSSVMLLLQLDEKERFELWFTEFTSISIFYIIWTC